MSDNAAAVDDQPGAHLLTELKETMQEYVIFPSEEAAVAVTLWIAATFGQRAWQHAPRLVITGPTKRCGKSRLLDVVHESCWKPLITVNATVAAIFRSIGDDPPTLLVDEADTLFGTAKVAENNEDLRGLLNAGHQRNRPTLRVVGVGTEQKVKEFPTFGMAALAGIGGMPDTIMDRAIVVQMRRRGPGESVKPFRTRRDAPRFTSIGMTLVEWLRPATDALADMEPDMPLEDRAADTWEPLIIIADHAGGDWPKLARHAAEKMVKEQTKADADNTFRGRILLDCRRAFRAASWPGAMKTDDLLEQLKADREAPWADWGREGLTARKLGNLLSEYEITSGNVRFPDGQKKGYLRVKFEDAWARYCPANDEDDEETQGEASQASQASPPRSDAGRQELWDGSDPSQSSIRPALTSTNELGTDGTDNRESPDSARLNGYGSSLSRAPKCAVCGFPFEPLEPGQTKHPGCEAA
ncbi:DUF3631 domain-containing protein [Streptomyces sp. NPDC054940]